MVYTNIGRQYKHVYRTGNIQCYQPHILITHCKSRITVDCLALFMLCIWDLSAIVSIFRVKEWQTVQELNQKSGAVGCTSSYNKASAFPLLFCLLFFSFISRMKFFFSRRLQLKLKNLKLHEKYILILGMYILGIYRTSGGVYVPCIYTHAR